ncbi:max dimerization protein 1-like isoform X2 [Atheta coriaria]|uniref:max dimerization protein 1-like isoform X2 n=1 Tax=Dalotia coriaria TaxID=877792 RepID=UPI0031F3A6FF
MNASLFTLLKAAEFIERRDRGLEHGYASTRPMPDDLRNPMKRPKTKKSQGSRTSHNELEKHRRAHLRHCLDDLKVIVPLGPEASKHTTLGLLTKARRFIKSLEDRDKRKALIKETLSREQRYLRRKLDALAKSQGCSPTTAAAALAASKRRSVSECSSSTISSSHSSSTTSSHSSAPSPISETGESGYSSSPLPSPTLLAARHPPPPPPGDDHAYHRHTADVFDYDAPDEVDVIGYTSTQSDTDDHSSVQSASSDSGVTMSTSRLTLSEIRDVYM